MSIPPPLTVAVIGQDRWRGGEIDVASCYAMEMSYLLLKPLSDFRRYRWVFKRGCNEKAIDLSGKYRLLKSKNIHPHQVDFWLAMDDAGEKTARKLVKKAGESPYNGMYSRAFPDKVAHCGFVVPPLRDDGNFKEWLDFLREHLAPWRDRFGQIMSDAS